MKISKQERILIIVFLVAAIIGVGIFVFVLPNFNKIETNNKQLAAVESELQEINTHLDHAQTIDGEISQAYEDGKNLADTFFDDLTEYEADEIVRQFIASGTDITVDGLSISPFSTRTISISVFKPTEVTYPLKEFADTVVAQPDNDEVDITSMSTRERVMYAKKQQAIQLSQSDSVTVGNVEVSFTAHSSKLQNLHDFINLLYSGKYNKDLPAKATYISNVEYQMAENSATSDGESGDNTSTSATESASAKGYSMNISVSLMCIKPVADPFATESAE